MDKTIKELILRLHESFDGEPWYGESLMVKLSKVDFKIVNRKPFPSANSIARLVQHIINWRIFVIRKLQEDSNFDIQLNDANDWTDINLSTEQDWDKLMEDLRATQQQITELLEANADRLWKNQVSGRNYDYQHLLEGIVQHDIYHLGQIGLVIKIVENR